ncbi:MAG: hypothetical protein RMA76_33500 [Deltaproteobacteria bacterium]|jgi:hypothetical protein
MHRLFILCTTFVVACGAEPYGTTSRAVAPDAPLILSNGTLARYRAALPTVAHRRLQEILEAPSTIWFDKETMIPSYQDSVGDGSYTPIGARANSRGRGVIVPAGRRLFSDDGEHWSFPFGHTAGTDRTPNKVVINFMSLPADERGFLPVVYETFDDNRALGGLGLHKWTWLFPVGTMMGEVIFLEESDELYPVEVRTRQRYLTGWATNAYRPFPAATQLADAIKREAPSWASDAQLSALVAHLERPDTLAAKTLRSPDFNDIFVTSGFEDVLPPVGDAELVKHLLTTTTFKSAYGLPWKIDGTNAAFYATTNETFSVVPADSDIALLEVRESSCVRCHQEAGRPIDDFEPEAILYGDIWGEDRIFSFHPWDQDRYVEFNTENRRVRPLFDDHGIVARLDRAKHPDTIYRTIP